MVYGITGGAPDLVTPNAVNMAGSYGTLTLNTSTGAYSYEPNDSAIEALNANATESFILTASDGSLSSSTPLVVNIEAIAEATTTGLTLDVLAYSWKAHTLLDEVSVAVGGQLATTDANGAASVSGLAATDTSVTATRAVLTDEAASTNGAVNLQDAIAILKMIVGLDVNGGGKAVSPYKSLAADFDGNGTVGLTDAIGVLKHVVGLTAPAPSWHLVNELDATVPAKAGLSPGVASSSFSVNLASSTPAHVGLVGYLSGDVDGSFAGAAGAQDLDVVQPGYFTALLDQHPELDPAQFGIYA